MNSKDNLPVSNSKHEELISSSLDNCRSNPQKGIDFADEALNIANPNSQESAQALVCKGACQVWLGDYEGALKNLFEPLQILASYNDIKFQAHGLYHIFCAFYFLADYDNALKYALELLKNAEKTSDSIAQANAYNGIGSVYHASNQNEKAIEILTKGLIIAEKLSDKHLLARILDGIGSSYFNLKNIEKSIEFKERSLEAARSIGLKNTESFGLDGLAQIYLATNDLKKAEQYFKECLEIREDLNFKFGISETNLHLGNLYIQLNELDKAQSHLTIALDLAQESNSKEIIYKAHEGFSKLYEKQANNGKFIEHFKKYFTFKEEFFSEKNKQKISAVEMQFNISQIEKEKELLGQKNKQLELLSNDLVVLSDLGKTIISQLSVESINMTVYKIISDLMDAKGFGIGIITDDNTKLTFPGYIENDVVLGSANYNLKDNNRLAVVCYNKDQEIIINDYESEVNQYIQVKLQPTIGEDVKSIIYLPLKLSDKKIGVLTVQSFNKNAFSEYQVNLVKNLAVYCAIAIENATLYEKQEERVLERTKEVVQQKEAIERAQENSRLLNEIGQQIISSFSFESIFAKLHENVSKLMNADCFSVRIYNEEKQEIDYRYAYEKGNLLTPVKVSMSNIDNYSVWCVSHKKEIFINDNVNEYQKYTSKIVVPRGEMPSSLLFCPLFIGERITGVITVQSFQKNAYVPSDMDILKTLGTYTAIALENANLVEGLEVIVNERTSEIVDQKEQIEKSFKNTELIGEIGKEISASLSVEEIIGKVYQQVNSLMDATIFGIGLYRAENNDIYFSGAFEKGEKLSDFSYNLDDEKTAVHCFKNNKEFFINDWGKEYSKYVSNTYKALQGDLPESMIYMPLFSKGKIIGVITVQSFEKNKYNEYHVDVLRNLSVYVGNAIENANLYKGLEEKVTERTKEVILQKEEIEKSHEKTRLLSEMGQQIISSISFTSIFKNLHENVNKLMDASCFGIRIYDPIKREIEYRYEIENGEEQETLTVSMDDIDNFSVWCVTNKKEIYINDNFNEHQKYISKVVLLTGDMPNSLIFCPMIIGEKITGVITVQSFQKNAYVPSDIDILKTLGTYTAIALENANLVEGLEVIVNERTSEIVEQKEQIEKSFKNTELIGEIGKEIAATLSVDDIISTVYQQINRLLDATIFGIGLYRAEEDDIYFSGAFEKGVKLDSFSYELKDDKTAAHCFNLAKEFVINDLSAEIKRSKSDTYDTIVGDLPESMIYLPLFSKGKTIGVISVQSFEKNKYKDYHVDVLRNLSVYVGSAIENANLYKGLEEKVTERTKEVILQKEEIEKSHENTRLLSEMGQQIISSISFNGIFKNLHENVNRLMDAGCFGVRIYDPIKREIEYRYEIENGEEQETFTVSMDNIDNFSVWCVTNRKEIYINDNLNEYQKYTSKIVVPAGDMPNSLIFCPMMIGERIVGVITVQSFDKFAYKPLHVDFLKTLGTYTAIALENANLVENLEDKVRERTSEVVKQKEIIEESNKHITDSIKYAKRIQDAFLPGEESISDHFKNSFILYKPKDIVSGDFYWFERKGNKILYAVVDCTGHGVPGAFMSIIGFNGLNQIVNEYNYTKPADILTHLNKSISNTLRQTVEDSKIRDGMDVAICSIDLDTNKLEFAGAFSPLFIIRNDEVIKFKGDKHPIGNYINEEEFVFTNNEIDLFPEDKIYIFSDGFVDQFGGPNGKKLKYDYFRKLLLDNHKKPMPEQKEEINLFFEDWKTGYEQIDDVCIIGVAI